MAKVDFPKVLFHSDFDGTLHIRFFYEFPPRGVASEGTAGKGNLLGQWNPSAEINGNVLTVSCTNGSIRDAPRYEMEIKGLPNAANCIPKVTPVKDQTFDVTVKNM